MWFCLKMLSLSGNLKFGFKHIPKKEYVNLRHAKNIIVLFVDSVRLKLHSIHISSWNHENIKWTGTWIYIGLKKTQIGLSLLFQKSTLLHWCVCIFVHVYIK